MSGLFKRFWIAVVVTVSVLTAAVVLGRLRTFFDSDQPYTGGTMQADVIVPINTKPVTYEIVGPPDTSGRVSYLDVDGKTIEAGFTSLPWSVTVRCCYSNEFSVSNSTGSCSPSR